jgi:hypothetical protein
MEQRMVRVFVRPKLRVSVPLNLRVRSDQPERMREVAVAELLIDCEEDRVLRAVLIGMVREGDKKPWR